MSERRNSQTIPSSPTTGALRGALDVSRTADGPRIGVVGSGGDEHKGIRFVDAPAPVPASTNIADNKMTWEKIQASTGFWLTIAGTLVGLSYFFFQMNSNISDVKSDVKESLARIGKVDEKVEKTSHTLDLANGSIQRLESEVRRTQDMYQKNNK